MEKKKTRVPFDKEAFEKKRQQYPLATLKEAFQEMLRIYREERKDFLSKDIHFFAYLVYRLPATYQALGFVLKELKHLMGEEKIETVLDLGAGPGASPTLFHEHFPTLQKVSLFEAEKTFISLSKECITQPKNVAVEWKQTDLYQEPIEEKADVTLFSYVLNEIPLESAVKILERAYAHTKKYLILIEQGSKEGFQRILAYRDFFIEKGANIIAPCPHANQCPRKEMERGHWCHFSTRLERSSLHRQVKGAALGYEDEKFCYLIVAPEKKAPHFARVIDKSNTKSRLAILPLCTTNGYEKRTVTKGKNTHFSELKTLVWGDSVLEEKFD